MSPKGLSRLSRPSRRASGSKRNAQVPYEAAAIIRELEIFLNQLDHAGRKPANVRCGVYVFYDYDGEPIYVGQTYEQLRVRIRRHLTNQRTDAVAMNVLDPFEVAEVEIYPFYDLEHPLPGESDSEYLSRRKEWLAAAEFTVYQKIIRESALGAVLNEADVEEKSFIELPASYRNRIVPDDVYELRKHPDIRIARRASTVANLARVISERDVSPGLRRTLLTQARRIEKLSRERLDEVLGSGLKIPIEDVSDEREITDDR